MRFYVFCFLLLLYGTAGAEGNKPRLIIGITVDQFYPEWLPIYESILEEGGLKRLTTAGKRTVADYGYLYSQTGVDQATIYTGTLPATHGIVAHDWYDRLRRTRENNVADRDFPEIGRGDSVGGYSPEHLQALSLGCALKMNDVFSKVFSIAANPEVAVLSGGTCADMCFWLSERSGMWVSSSFYADSLPAWLGSYNQGIESDFLIRRGWMPLTEEQSSSLSLKMKSKLGLGNSFFYDIAQVKRKFNTYRVLKATPYINTLLVDLAGQLISAEGLGKDNDVDLLTIGFSCLDYMNRDFGIYAREFQDMVQRLDKDVQRLLDLLDAKVGRENYTVMLTFTEARELLPEELGKMRIGSGYFSIFKSVALLKSYLNLVYGDGEWIADYDAGQIYLNRELIEKHKLLLKDVQDRVADFMADFEGISKVTTAYSLARNAFSHGSEMLMQNAFSQKKSGDVMFCLQPAWLPVIQDREDGYFRHSKRNKVPVYLYGAGVTAKIQAECNMTDMLPTLCRIAEVPLPYTAGGKSVLP